MNYFVLEPEVAGSLGPHTVMDRNSHPPVVAHLHYEFDGWLGDAIVESFPCFLVTEELWKRLSQAGALGALEAAAEVSTSSQFFEVNPTVELPKYVWLQVTGRAGVDGRFTGTTSYRQSRSRFQLFSLGLSRQLAIRKGSPLICRCFGQKDDRFRP